MVIILLLIMMMIIIMINIHINITILIMIMITHKKEYQLRIRDIPASPESAQYQQYRQYYLRSPPTHPHIYIYIYIYRERERERESVAILAQATACPYGLTAPFWFIPCHGRCCTASARAARTTPTTSLRTRRLPLRGPRRCWPLPLQAGGHRQRDQEEAAEP